MSKIHKEFLIEAIEAIETLQRRSLEHGFPTLNYLLDIAKAEAADDLQSRRGVPEIPGKTPPRDESGGDIDGKRSKTVSYPKAWALIRPRRRAVVTR